MKDFVKTIEGYFDNIGRGLIYINESGTIVTYSMLARKITNILGDNDMEHDSGKLEEGDIVIIADNDIGNDDDMTPDDLKYIGIKNKRIKMGSAILAVGVYRDFSENGEDTKGDKLRPEDKTEFAKPEYKYASNYNPNGSLSLKSKYLGHEISIDALFGDKKLLIEVDGKAVEFQYFEAVGHMVVVDSETGEIKFFQSRGYGYRKEEIGKLLRGKYFVAKITSGYTGDASDNIKVDNITGKHYSDGIFDRKFVTTIKGYLDSIRDVMEEGVFEIHQRPFFLTIMRIKQWSENDGVYIAVMGASEFENLVSNRSDIIKQLERIQWNKKSVASQDLELDSINALMGKTGAMLEVKQLAYKASKGKFNVLITGESGTGKTRLAREIHNLSGAAKPFIEVNLSAIPESLFESELFGYVGGAFTGASGKGKEGYFEAANGGTLFLDEIGEIPTTLQSKLLQVLQSKKVYRVGSTIPIDIDVRVIASTNIDIKQAVLSGAFREDLYYRLDVFPIEIPPLRSRKGDVRELAEHFLSQACQEYGLDQKRFSEDAYEKLLAYDWPGNVRELENAVMRAVAICDSPVIYEDYLLLLPLINQSQNQVQSKNLNPNQNSASAQGNNINGLSSGTLKAQTENFEKEIIRRTLDKYNGNRSKAMKELNISKTVFYEKLKKYDILQLR